MTLPSPTWLWAGILMGPLAFAADLMARYGLVKWSCSTNQTAVLTFITMTSFVAAVCAVVLSWRAFMKISTAPRNTTALRRAVFMAWLGLMSAAFFAVVIVASAVPQWVLDACR